MKNKKQLLEAFETVYKSSEAKKLLQQRWYKENINNGPHSTGFCYIAAEVAFHLLKKQKPKAFCASYVEGNKKSTHWWIEHNIQNWDISRHII